MTNFKFAMTEFKLAIIKFKTNKKRACPFEQAPSKVLKSVLLLFS